jgi:hypothetical protein
MVDGAHGPAAGVTVDLEAIAYDIAGLEHRPSIQGGTFDRLTEQPEITATISDDAAMVARDPVDVDAPLAEVGDRLVDAIQRLLDLL